MKQVHGNRVAVLDKPRRFARPGFHALEDTDGVLTCVKGLVLVAMSADCLPVFFYCRGRRFEWVGLVHAGWRGTRAGVVARAFRSLVRASGCRSSDVSVHLGPRICGAHYEVGSEFTRYFRGGRGKASRTALVRRQGRFYFDLAAETRRQLLRCGARRSRIEDCGLCTVRDNRDFFSFRMEHESCGRMISFIRLD